MLKGLVSKGVDVILNDQRVVAAVSEAKKALVNGRLKAEYSLSDLADNIREINRASGRGLGQPSEDEKIVQLMLIVTKVTAAAQTYSSGRPEHEFVGDLADIIIQTLDVAAYWNYDIDTAMRHRLEKNKTGAGRDAK